MQQKRSRMHSLFHVILPVCGNFLHLFLRLSPASENARPPQQCMLDLKSSLYSLLACLSHCVVLGWMKGEGEGGMGIGLRTGPRTDFFWDLRFIVSCSSPSCNIALWFHTMSDDLHDAWCVDAWEDGCLHETLGGQVIGWLRGWYTKRIGASTHRHRVVWVNKLTKKLLS